jgi:transposase
MSDVKYVGMDVHKAITVIVVLNARGQVESRAQVRTKAQNICDFFCGLSGKVEVILEEGTQSAWLYTVLKPVVSSVTVCDPRHNKLIGAGNKSDDDDAETLARLLRMGEVKTVYKGSNQQQEIKELSRTYSNLVKDATRCQSRLKAIYRARGIDCQGHAIYRADQREEWLEKLPSEGARFRAASVLGQLEAISPLRKEAKARLTAQARKHTDYALLVKLPGFGPVRAAQLLAIIGTPYRFRTKRQLWPYCGLAVVTKSSADYQVLDSKIVKNQKKVSTRGLNRNHNPELKQVFKGAALGALRHQEVKAYYQRLIDNGTRPELARVSLARKLASIALTIWQRREEFDAKKAFANN